MAIKNLTLVKKHLFLCNGGSCKLLGAEETAVAVRSAIAENGLSDEVHTTKTLCNGRCKDGPVIISQPDGIWFKQMVKEEADRFVKEYLIEQVVLPDKILFEYGKDTIHV